MKLPLALFAAAIIIFGLGSGPLMELLNAIAYGMF